MIRLDHVSGSISDVKVKEAKIGEHYGTREGTARRDTFHSPCRTGGARSARRRSGRNIGKQTGFRR